MDYDINLPLEGRKAAQGPTGAECTDQTPEFFRFYNSIQFIVKIDVHCTFTYLYRPTYNFYREKLNNNLYFSHERVSIHTTDL